ncbi:hypothetical protein K0504_06350 [Neiella marina]|uniref:Uncharacterized protein n=1 Tax=Neiella holothuriorum TaxID=2870530 RepID=A0ABS7EE85_9GAMM|nr:hypothetical protein [Neiella holothuriorum]MBW8190654.1 hypothetical protein [Neiella holothuriorum]
MMDNRQLIPRWHTSRNFDKFNIPKCTETKSNALPKGDVWFDRAVSELQSKPNLENHIDIFVRLIQHEHRYGELYERVLSYLLDNLQDLPPAVKDLVIPKLRKSDRSHGYSTQREHVSLIIAKLKNIIVKYPKDSLTWMDLCFYYSILGEEAKAVKCARIAISISGNNSYIARSYARFLLHLNEPEQAEYFLRKTGLIDINPLIQSAYSSIVTTYDLRKWNYKKSIKLIDSWRGDPFFLTELLASLGTEEIKNGALSRGKARLEKALLTPSENVVSQAVWLNLKHKTKINNIPHDTPFEANVNKLYTSKNFTACREALMNLFAFQPYSTAPLEDAGYISLAALNDPQFVIDTSENRVPHTHMTFGELNNLVVAKLMLGDFSIVNNCLKLMSNRMDKTDIHQRSIFLATSGMALIKSGFIDEGVELYDKSMLLLKNNRSNRALGIASHFFAQQLKEINPERYKILSTSAKNLAKTHDIYEIVDYYNER